jgi:hypothetical protein
MTNNAELSLDERIATILKEPSGVPSATFTTLLIEIDSAITAAEIAGQEAQKAAYDPAVLDATAVGRAHDAQYQIRRLKNAVTALTPHLQATVRREARDAWESEASELRKQVEEAGADFKAGYLEHAGALLTLLKTSAMLDERVQAINIRAPDGVNRLRKVEAVARGLPFIEGKAFAMQVVIPALPSFQVALAQVVWPPQPPNPYLAYAQSVAAGILSAPPPPTDAERADAARRQIEIGERQERESERLRANAV